MFNYCFIGGNSDGTDATNKRDMELYLNVSSFFT